MKTVEIISISISFLALTISAITAYRTLFAKFRVEVFLKPRVALTYFDQGPSLVVGCEICNLGAKSGAIDDFVLFIKYRHQSTKSINTFSFLPLFSRQDYSVFKVYQKTDFEPFQSIPIPINSRLTQYIVFSPSNRNFSPFAGEMKLQLYSRSSGKSNWDKARGPSSFLIDEDSANIWGNSESKSILLETEENPRLRENLMEQHFS